MRKWFVMVVAAVLFAVPAFGQFVYPSELVNKLTIKRVTQWEFGKLTTNEGERYLAKITVLFENSSETGVVFKDPAFDATLRIEGMLSPGGSAKGAVTHNPDNEVVEVKNEFKKDAFEPVPLGAVRLPSEENMKAFDPKEELNLPAVKKEYPSELYIAGASKGVPNLVECDLVIDLGPVSITTANKLLLKVFNAVVGVKPAYSIMLAGDTRVGLRATSGTTTVYSPEAVHIELASKTLLPDMNAVKQR